MTQHVYLVDDDEAIPVDERLGQRRRHLGGAVSTEHDRLAWLQPLQHPHLPKYGEPG